MTVFAQIPVETFRRSAEEYQRGSAANFLIFAGLSLAVLLAAVLTWRISHYRNEGRRPLLLFYDLADFHNIPSKMQKKLIQLARAHDVADPACLFVCSDLVRRIESLEMVAAGNEKESRRLGEFFAEFLANAFGQGVDGTGGGSGGAQ